MMSAWRKLKQLEVLRNKEFGLPKKCILKKFYLAQSRRACREKNLSARASLRDKKYYGQAFLMLHKAAKMPSKAFYKTVIL
jgi:hypothetical protein